MTASRPLRVGMLGVGRIALEHARVLQTLGHRVVAGCCTSQSSPRWQQFSCAMPDVRFVADAAELLAAPDVEAVVACLPWNVTEQWLPRLFATPKPVLIEKPLALSSEALAAALSVKGTTLENKQVGLNRRFYATVQALKRRLQEGDVKAVDIFISEVLGRLIQNFGPEIIPHTLAYSSCHLLDAALYLLGPLTPIQIYSHDEQDYPLPFRSFSGLLETADGIPVTLAIHADAPVPVGIRCLFHDQSAWVLSPMERLMAYRGWKVIEAGLGSNTRGYMPIPFLEVAVESSHKPGFLEQMRAFTTGEGREIAATPAESAVLLQFIEAIQQMGARG